MKKQIKVLLIKQTGVEIVELEQHDIKKMYELIDCRCFTCVSRRIGKKTFDLWIDDEGLFKVQDDGTILVSAICMNAYEGLAGNILIARHKGADMDSLSDSDIALIKSEVISSNRDELYKYATNIGELVLKYKAGSPMLRYKV